MRRFLVVSLIAASCLCARTSHSQDRKDPPAKVDPLDELLAEAMKHNHDIKVAEAKLKLVEAKLERTRAKLKAKISVVYAEVEAARAGFAEGKMRYDRAYQLHLRDRAVITVEELAAAKLTMAKL